MSDRGSLMVITDVAFKSGLSKDQTLVFDICLPQNLLISAHGHVMVHGKLKTVVKNDNTIFFIPFRLT